MKQRLLWFLGAWTAALMMIAGAFFLMPDKSAPKVLSIKSALWVPKGNEAEAPIAVKTGFTIHNQLPPGTTCCSGTYSLTLDRQQLADFADNTDMLAVYFPALGGTFQIRINDQPIAIPARSDYSSVGPLIPLDRMLVKDGLGIKIQIDGSPNPYLGLWKGPAFVGSYYELFSIMENERDYQIDLPLFNAFALMLFGSLFFFLYMVSGRQSPYFLHMLTAFVLYGLFDVFLSGSVRQAHLYTGYVLHYPARILMNLGTYLLVANFIDTIREERRFSTGRPLAITASVLAGLAALNFLIGLTDAYTAIVWIVALSFLLPFWPLAVSSLYRREHYMLSLLTFGVLIFSCLASSADATKLVSRLFQKAVPYDYFIRYNSIILIAATIAISSFYFKTFFVTLQKERIGRMKAQGISRAIKMLAHDVRRPFSTVQLGLRVLSNTPAETQGAFIEKLKAQVSKHIDSVNTTLQDIMDFGSEPRLRKDALNLSELVREASFEASELHLNSPVTLVFDTPERFDISVDRHKMIRTLSNIIHNAYEAIRLKGGTITVRISSDQDRCHISIHNSNSFIPADKTKSIFEDFYTSDKPGGTGLGLAVAKEFVEAHGGTISCTSDISSGTCFSINLPRS